MKMTLKILLSCLISLFVSHSASYVQAQKYVKDSPPDTVRVFVENGKGEVQIVFKWTGEKPTTASEITYKTTDAVGPLNSIPAKYITFAWEPDSPKPPAQIIVGRLKVENIPEFNDVTIAYTGYVVFASETAGMAPDALKFELRKTPISSIPLNVDNNTFSLPGTNYLPSFMSPLFPGFLYLFLGFLFLIRGQFKDKVLFLVGVVVLILLVGLVISLLRTPGPEYSSVYTGSLKLTEGRNDQTPFPAKLLAILTSEKSGWGKIYLEKIGGDYQLTFRNLPRAGEYNGKIAANIISPQQLSVKVKVADWVLYFLATVLGGILAAHLMTKPIASAEFNSALVVAGGSVLSLLVTHFLLYTDTWGSPLDYVKAFAAGAGINLVTKTALAGLYRAGQVWLKKR